MIIIEDVKDNSFIDTAHVGQWNLVSGIIQLSIYRPSKNLKR